MFHKIIIQLMKFKKLSHVKNHLFQWQKYNPNLSIVQDDLLGIYLLTKSDENYPKEKVVQMCQNLIKSEYNSVHNYTQEYYTGKEIISFIIPNNFCYEFCGLKILYGKLLDGIIDKRSLNGNQSMFKYIDLIYNEDITLEFMSNLTFLSVGLLYNSYSVHLGDCKIKNYDLIQQGIDKYECEAELISEMFVNEMVRENKITGILHKSKDYSMKICNENVKNNNFLPMINSGSKGSLLNFLQIGSVLGQQYFQGERIGDSDHTRSLSCYPFCIESIKKI